MIENIPRLSPEMLAHVEDAARRVPEAARAAFLKSVSDILRPVRELTQTDVHRAVCIAMAKQRRFKKLDDDAT